MDSRIKISIILRGGWDVYSFIKDFSEEVIGQHQIIKDIYDLCIQVRDSNCANCIRKLNNRINATYNGLKNQSFEYTIKSIKIELLLR